MIWMVLFYQKARSARTVLVFSLMDFDSQANSSCNQAIDVKLSEADHGS